jgi:glucose/arabinose dehydrogenase
VAACRSLESEILVRHTVVLLAVAALLAALLAGCPSPPESVVGEEPVAPVSPTVTPGVASPVPSPGVEPSPRAYSPLPDDLALDRELVAQGLDQIVGLAVAPNDDRIFAVEKVGRIRVIEDGVVDPEPFLDITDEVRAGGLRSEQGMFSVAFHPDFTSNGRLFVYYVTHGDDDTRLEELRVDAETGRVDLATRRTVLDVHQPFRWHQGGAMMFGRDRMLWLSLGDGGVSGDPDLEAQNRANLLGSIVRIDVDGGDPYAIPPDNPFVDDEDAAPEVWAYGLRNPWRFDLDPVDGLAYIADVGQNTYEWVNVVPDDEGGWNFGWPILEGAECFEAHAELCPGEGFTDPVLVYEQDGTACAIIGGIVYDGSAIHGLAGHYLYTDFCGGWLRSFRYHDGEVRDERDWTESLGQFELPTTFGRDPSGEAIVADSEGRIWRIIARR